MQLRIRREEQLPRAPSSSCTEPPRRLRSSLPGAPPGDQQLCPAVPLPLCFLSPSTVCLWFSLITLFFSHQEPPWLPWRASTLTAIAPALFRRGSVRIRPLRLGSKPHRLPTGHRSCQRTATPPLCLSSLPSLLSRALSLLPYLIPLSVLLGHEQEAPPHQAVVRIENGTSRCAGSLPPQTFPVPAGRPADLLSLLRRHGLPDPATCSRACGQAHAPAVAVWAIDAQISWPTTAPSAQQLPRPTPCPTRPPPAGPLAPRPFMMSRGS